MFSTFKKFVCLSILLMLGTPHTAFAQHYDLTDIGSLLGSTDMEGWGINDSGQISGSANMVTGGYQHGFRTSIPGTSPIVITDLGMLPGRLGTRAYGINNLGQVTGSSYDPSSEVFRSSGNSSSSVSLTNFFGQTAQSLGINNSGEMTGQSSEHVFRSSANGASSATLTDLTIGSNNIGSNDLSIGYGINASGQVAGYFWNPGDTSEARNGFRSSPTSAASVTLTPLPFLSGGNQTEGLAINDSGEVVGYANLSNGSEHAFISSDNSVASVTLTDLGTLGGPNSRAWGINDSGEIVGDSDIKAGVTDAFLFTNGQMFDLNALIPANSGVDLTEALGINSSGDIVAWGSVSGSTYTHTFLLTPATPEPGPIALICASVVVGFWRMRRKQ